MTELDKYLVDEFKTLFYEPSGQNHYRLLYDLCSSIPLVFDVGTYKGASAIAMSSAKKVITFDITEYKGQLPPNVEQIISDDFTKHPDLLKANIILIDTDPHDGEKEKYFFDQLVKLGYQGTVIFDDIHLNEGMKGFWNSITQDKEDMTEIGHYTGTGIVYL